MHISKRLKAVIVNLEFVTDPVISVATDKDIIERKLSESRITSVEYDSDTDITWLYKVTYTGSLDNLGAKSLYQIGIKGNPDIKVFDVFNLMKMHINDFLFDKKYRAYLTIKEPVRGDWVIYPTGEQERIASIWPEDIQTCKGGSFYLSESGDVSFSGGLNSAIPKEGLELIPQKTKLGQVWFFDEGIQGAGRGVNYNMNFKVWKTSQPYPQY